MEVRVDNRGNRDAAWEYLSSCRDALYILRVAGTVEVLGGVRTRGLEGRCSLKCKHFNLNWTVQIEILAFKFPSWTSEPLAIIDALMHRGNRSISGIKTRNETDFSEDSDLKANLKM